MSNKEPTLTGDGLAKVFGFESKRSIQQLAKDGIIPKAGTDTYPFISATTAYIKHLKNNGSGASKDEYNEGRARKITAEADEREMKNEVRAGTLYEKIDIDQKLSEAFKVFQQAIITLPDVAERDADLSSEQVHFIINICDNALEQLSGALENLKPENA